jgi:predicted transcriptional regulator
MTDKQTVAEVLNRMPENATLDEIAEEVQILAAIRQGREDIVAGRKKEHKEVENLLESWATQWNSK